MAGEKKFIDDLVMRGAHIFLKDFKGTKFGDGKRKFGLVLDAETAQNLAALGVNVKQFDPQQPGNEPTYFINVNVSYKVVEPVVRLVSNGNMVALHESNVGVLDATKFANADVVVHFNWYEFGKGAAHKEGFTAYLNELWVTARSSMFEQEYNSKYGASTAPDDDVEELPFA